MSTNKNPPLLSKSAVYSDWKKKLEIWGDYTSVEKRKQGAAVLLTLEGPAEEVVLELERNEINSEDGLDKVIEKLDNLYLKDSTLEKFEALEKFDTCKRVSNSTIQEHIHEFEKLYFKLKSHGTTISEDLLAYKLLKSANLSEQDEKMARGMVSELTLTTMKIQLKKMFNDTKASSSDNLRIHEINEVMLENEHTPLDGDYETFYMGRRVVPNQRPQYYGPKSPSRPPPSNQQRYQPRYPPRNIPARSNGGMNPRDGKTGQLSRCNICQSVYHWVSNCPEKQRMPANNYQDQQRGSANNYQDQRPIRSSPWQQQNQTFYGTESDMPPPLGYDIPPNDMYHEIILFQSDYDHPLNLKGLVSESWNAAVLDSGATKTVCGRDWFNTYVESLSESDRAKVRTTPVNHFYRFGDANTAVASQSAALPAVLGHQHVTVNTDIVERNIPLLLSRESMKKASMSIDFVSDSAIVLGKKVMLSTTQSGHITIPLTASAQILATMGSKTPNIVLTVINVKSKHDQALKLHRQFAHAPTDKLIRLVDSAGEQWANDTELKKELALVAESCQTCLEYRKAAARPVVGLPCASTFLETVAMDLKFYNSKILLHMIDHATRLSMCVRIPNKKPETIVQAIFSHWVSVYGTTQKFLTDNGGEFANEDFISMCESLNICVKTTGAESPWSNGLVERHNLTIANMLDKVLNDTDVNFDIALSWCVNAKNSLENCHGFSPYQLAMGRNPQLPGFLHDKPPALTSAPTSDVIRQNLNALHAARVAFTESENSERLRRAASHNTRTYSDQVFTNGDNVYYKRNGQKKWKGPAVVLGKDGQQVLLKHSSFYIRVHPCRVMLAKEKLTAAKPDHQPNLPNTNTTLTSNDNVNNKSEDSSDDDEDVINASSTTAEPPSLPPRNLDSPSPSSAGPSPTAVHVPTPPKTPGRTSFRACHATRLDVTPNQRLNVPESTDPPAVLPASAPISQRSNPRYLRKHDKVVFQHRGNSSWISCTLQNRSGKQGGKWKHSWNIILKDGSITSVDFEHDVSIWKYKNQFHVDTDTEIIDCPTFIAEVDRDIEEAKKRELHTWQEQEVYDEVNDEGQQCISVRWVITPKVIDGVPSSKARLCAKGFQESESFRTDSPTCTKDSIRSVLAITAMKKWTLNSADIQAAFLQGSKMDRTVYLRPPKEAETTKVWRLRKCVYGLSDAPRQFFLRLWEELLKLGVTPSPNDPGLYYWYHAGKLAGILCCHVDDMLWSGTNHFKEQVLDILQKVLKFGSEQSIAFKYTGIELVQNEDFSIFMHQNSFSKSLTKILLPEGEDKTTPLQPDCKKMFRSAIGKLNWLATISRPEISFEVSFLSGRVSDATIADAIDANKLINRVQNEPTGIRFPSLDETTTHLQVYADGSFNSLPNNGSQGGQMVLLCDHQNRCSLLSWSSTKIKRVVRSALGAETLSMCDGSESAFFLADTLTHVLKPHEPLQVYALTDSRSLYEHLGTSKQAENKRLRVEISALRQMIEEDDIRLKWVDGSNQISNPLTKRGASVKLLREVIYNGLLPRY